MIMIHFDYTTLMGCMSKNFDVVQMSDLKSELCTLLNASALAAMKRCDAEVMSSQGWCRGHVLCRVVQMPCRS
jgi:hypothetical protein